MEECNNILTMDKNFNEYDFGEIVKGNKNNENLAITQYRYILLQKRDIENEDYTVNKENFERLFLQGFTDKQFKRLLKRVEHNGWSARGLLCEVIKCKGADVDYISTSKC